MSNSRKRRNPKKGRRKKKQQMLFSPVEIVTEIRSALIRDVQPHLHEYEERTASHYAMQVQMDELLKKFVPPGVDQDDLVKAVYSSFLQTDEHLSLYNNPETFPDINKVKISRHDTFRTRALIRARAVCYAVLGQFSTEKFYRHCKNSGGSSLGVRYQDTSSEAKFTYPISATREVKSIFEEYLLYDSYLKEQIIDHNLGHDLKYDFVEGSRATTVDKTAKKRRMICVEPTANMFMQQGLMQYMYDLLRAVGLDVEELPTTHQYLAKVASITSGYATIDWSSASDCVSIELLRWLIPPAWFDMVMKVRCSRIFLNGEYRTVNAISTMGNAGTFPLETLAFWALAVGATRSLRPGNSTLVEYEDKCCCSVFGDDCIVPSEVAKPFIGLCESVGFLVNEEKSFYGNERFRESCGGDYYRGYNVRPYHLKASQSMKRSSLEPWLYIIFNSLQQKYISYFGLLGYVYEKELFKTLFALMSKYDIRIKVVPWHLPDDAGLKISSDLLRYRRCYRFREEPIARGKHENNGYVVYKYCRFQYWDCRNVHDGIRLAMKLKKTSDRRVSNLSYLGKTQKPVQWLPIRRRGGYVVGKGQEYEWQVPL